MADVIIESHGSIVLLIPNSEKALDWVEKNIGKDNGYQPYWPKVLCETRYVPDIVTGMAEDGLIVN